MEDQLFCVKTGICMVWYGVVWCGTVLNFDFTLFFRKGEFSVTGFTAAWRKDITYIAEDRE